MYIDFSLSKILYYLYHKWLTYNTLLLSKIRIYFNIRRTECGFLELNYINCLKEKSKADVVSHKRKCNNEQVNLILSKIVWFNLECPDKWARFNDPVRLRSIFIKDKLFEK
jgi:hypothetical protein